MLQDHAGRRSYECGQIVGPGSTGDVVHSGGFQFQRAYSGVDPGSATFGTLICPHLAAWCNFCTLAERLVEKAFPGARVGAVKYFTANVGNFGIAPGEADRQRLWLDALKFETRGQIRVVKGFHDKNDDKPRVEKQTDTKLAIT